MRYFLVTMFWFLALSASAAEYWGNFPDGGTLYFYTNTVGTDGVAETPVDEAIAVYKDGSDTELAGATIDDDIDSVDGLHRIAIDTNETGYVTGSHYTVMYTDGTVDGVSIAGRVIGSFFLGPKNADVTHFGGSAGTFSDGRPQVNASHWGGTAVGSATVNANATQISGSSTAANNAEVIFDTDFSDVYDGAGHWNVNVEQLVGYSQPVDNMNMVFQTDFASNYNTTADKWNANVTHLLGTAWLTPGTAGTPDVNMKLISDDASAANNFETMLDGSGGQSLSLGRLVIDNDGAPTVLINQDGEEAAIQISEAGNGIQLSATTGIAFGGSMPTDTGVNLMDDTITAAKFDTLTAFPLVDTDSGSTRVARTGAGSDTLETLSDEFGVIGGVVDAIFAFIDGAPTFGEAMDGHQYTSARALKLDNLDMAVSDLPSRSPGLLVSATIDDSSIAVTQTSFALSVGPPDDDALNGALVIVTADTDSSKKAVGLVKDYDGMTRTLTLVTDPEVFTFADGDQVDVIATGEPAALWLGSTP